MTVVDMFVVRRSLPQLRSPLIDISGAFATRTICTFKRKGYLRFVAVELLNVNCLAEPSAPSRNIFGILISGVNHPDGNINQVLAYNGDGNNFSADSILINAGDTLQFGVTSAGQPLDAGSLARINAEFIEIA